MWSLLLVGIMAACQPTGNVIYVTATPPLATALPAEEATLPNPFKPTLTPSGPTATARIVTPNPTYPPTPSTATYTIVAGDTLGGVAALYGTTVQDILSLNPGLTETSVLNVGQTVTVPGTPTQRTPNNKLVPDSEVIYSPGSIGFDVAAYIKFQPGFIRVYTEDVSGRRLTGADIIRFFAQSTSINPRLLLALLEYRGGWITDPVPDTAQMTYPMGYVNDRAQGLFLQMSWAVNRLNEAYYGYKHRGLSFLEFPDRTRLAYAPELNPGTIAVQYVLGRSAPDRQAWLRDVAPGGFFTTYMAMFGDPFRTAIEPLVPPDLQQPEFGLPFPKGEVWFLTSGPHGGWDASGSGWAAVDFAPPAPPDELVVQQGFCYVSPNVVLAIVRGLVVRAGDGAVIIDLDMDGDERTGWTVNYLHVDDTDMIKAGTIVEPGTIIGHPSCAGFFLNSIATHVHIARRYNGEWIPADCWACPTGIGAPPFVMAGWRVRGYANQVFQGWLEKDGQVVRAEQGRDDPINQIQWN